MSKYRNEIGEIIWEDDIPTIDVEVVEDTTYEYEYDNPFVPKSIIGLSIGLICATAVLVGIMKGFEGIFG